jgi:GNAT superfamily N-acetyltransferase
MWTFRPARPDEAIEACTVLRRSITELCQADHRDNPALLAAWLANKTPDNVAAWIEANPTGFVVGVGPDGIVGVGSVTATGDILLNYVAPWARFRGVSKALLAAMEQRAARGGATECSLTSSTTAHDFYRRYGYQATGPAVPSFGGMLSFPMRRQIAW